MERTIECSSEKSCLGRLTVRSAIVATVLLAAHAACATDFWWVGLPGAFWGPTAWADSSGKTGDPNSSQCNCHVTNETPVNITVPGAGRTICRMFFSGANHSLSSGTGTIKFEKHRLYNPEPFCGIDVDSGLTMKLSVCNIFVGGSDDFHKTGGGALSVTRPFGSVAKSFAALHIDEGSMTLDAEGPHALCASNCVMSANTSLKVMTGDAFLDNATFAGESGAVLDLAGTTQHIASVSGAFTVTNSAVQRATLVLADGLSLFSGRIEGDVLLVIASGATLDLEGRTLHVAAARQEGRVINGTLIADRWYGRGLVIMVK